jgi:hypothetical protein
MENGKLKNRTIIQLPGALLISELIFFLRQLKPEIIIS